LIYLAYLLVGLVWFWLQGRNKITAGENQT